ncbi:YeeE/YedE family protein [Salinibius halmophilus]|uniref:YeeE/YedE family protein n=1 Tax=Salinibius halmophilus TaxID=1853216 RepID=UPI000E66F405|nr:YeeE/YedE thiosulfate transporter family protein [Salinibius halmophilus]
MQIVSINPFEALLGGILLGISTTVLLLLRGDVAGINGMITGILSWKKREVDWRVSFIIGLMLGLGAYVLFFGTESLNVAPLTNEPMVMLAGLLVGIGATIGNGCTSGHGICGIARFSTRSIVATLTFMGTAALTVYFYY